MLRRSELLPRDHTIRFSRHRLVQTARGTALMAMTVTLFSLFLPPAQAIPPGNNWPAFMFGVTHSSFNKASVAITPANAANLVRAWTWLPAPPTIPGQPSGLFASPTVVNGRIYIGANTGDFYALNEATGQVIWKQFIGFVTAKSCSALGFVSTATVASDPVTRKLTVYVAAADGYLYALNASDGTVYWKSLVVDPGIDQNEGYNWGSPTVVAGHIYMGMSSQCDNPLIRGGLKEFDQATGALLNTYYTVPDGSIGGSIWSSAGAAVSAKYVFVTTGNAPTEPVGDSFSIVRLDGNTLAKQDSWMIPNAGGTDNDFGSSPAFFSANVGGRQMHLVTACNKNGYDYGWDQQNLSAGPLWQTLISNGMKGGHCISGSAWDGTHLFVAAVKTTINGIDYQGSVQELDPGTGTPIWQTGLPGGVQTTPTINGSGVIGVASYDPSGAPNAGYLVNASDGSILTTIDTGNSKIFGQLVFAGAYVFVASFDNGISAYTPAG